MRCRRAVAPNPLSLSSSGNICQGSSSQLPLLSSRPGVAFARCSERAAKSEGASSPKKNKKSPPSFEGRAAARTNVGTTHSSQSVSQSVSAAPRAPKRSIATTPRRFSRWIGGFCIYGWLARPHLGLRLREELLDVALEVARRLGHRPVASDEELAAEVPARCARSRRLVKVLAEKKERKASVTKVLSWCLVYF